MTRKLSDEEMDHYRRPFVDQGESRRPTLSWPRNIPIDGEPADVVSVVNDYNSWLAESDVPKLFVNAEPGGIVHGRIRDLIRSWPNLTETTVSGLHFVQEDSPDEIGTAVAQFVRKLRALAATGTELAPGHSPGRVGEPGRQRVGRTESTPVKGSKQ
jgi:haloalkane dehalogenase